MTTSKTIVGTQWLLASIWIAGILSACSCSASAISTASTTGSNVGSRIAESADEPKSVTVVLVDATIKGDQQLFESSLDKTEEIIGKVFSSDEIRPQRIMIATITGASDGGNLPVLCDEVLLDGKLKKVTDEKRYPSLYQSFSKYKDAMDKLEGVSVTDREGTEILRSIDRSILRVGDHYDGQVDLWIFSDMFEQSDLINMSDYKAIHDGIRAHKPETISSMPEFSAMKTDCQRMHVHLHVLGGGKNAVERMDRKPDYRGSLLEFWQQMSRQFHWQFSEQDWNPPF